MSKKDLSSREVRLNDAKWVEGDSAAVRAYDQKLAQRNRWNMALAAASGTELKLIKVDHRVYPLHLICRCCNHFVLEFNDGYLGFCDGRIPLGKRRDYIGPRYSTLRHYYIMPISDNMKESFIRQGIEFIDIYELLNCILNGTETRHFKKEDLKMARTFIERKAVVV